MAATLPPPRLLPSGDRAITVEFSRNIDDAANRRVLALDRAHGARAGRGRHRDRADLSLAAGALRSRRRSISTRLASRLLALAQRPVPAATKSPALAHSGGLWRRARHRPRGRRQDAQHHAGRDRGAACRRRLPRRHDRLHARLVVSQRADGLAAHAAAAESASADAGRHGLDRRRADRRAVPRRPERLASAGTNRRSDLSARIAIRSSCWSPATTSRLRRSTPKPSRSRTAPPKPANSSPS